MRILILGGTGFIGPPAVRRLVELGHGVTVFHRGATDATDALPIPTEVRHIHGDRKQIESFADTFRALAPEVVVDLNAYSQNDAELLGRLFTGVAQRLVVISSGDVYRAYDRLRKKDVGPPDPSPLTEDSPVRDRLFPYADPTPSAEDQPKTYEKILVERAVMAASDKLPATVLRLPMVYGPGDYQHRCFSYLKRMEDGRPFILLPEDISGWQGLRGYVEDIGDAIARCAVDDRAANRIYNVADPHNATESEWVRRIGKAFGWTGEIVSVPQALLPESMRHDYATDQHWGMDSSRIRRELDYSEPTAPDTAMQRTIDWERAHPPEKINESDYDYVAEDAVFMALPGK